MIYFMAFLVPALIWIISIALGGIFPFGNNTILTSDMAYQYAGYFEFLQNSLTQGVNPIFSFYKGMGQEALGMLSYYMFSPFNLILTFFKSQNITEAILCINMLKIGACGLTFSIFLNNKFKGNNKFAIIAFSTCYALMAYNIAYQFNIMWLDGVVWLPIIILGIDRIINKNRSELFFISLCIVILSNWYIGFMLCVFSGIYTVYNLITNKDIVINKRVLKKVILFGILAGVIALIVIIPSAITCMNETPRNELSQERTVSYKILDIFSKFIIGGTNFEQITDFKSKGYLNLPNLFAGTTVLLLFIIYFFNKSINKDERIKDGIFTGILILITLLVPLNKIWHVFTYNVWFPYRYSFCITFFMIYIAYKSFLNIKSIDIKTIFKICIGVILGCFIVEKFDYDYIVSETVYCTIFMIFAGFIAIKLVKNNQKSAYFLLTIVMCTEMFVNSAVYFQKFKYTDRNVFYEDRQKVVNDIEKIGNKGYYRIENDILEDYNGGIGKKYLSIASSSTMGNDSERGLLEALGYTRVMNNSIRYKPTTRFGDSFLGVKYFITDNEIKENDDALSLGFISENSVKNIKEFTTKWGKHKNSFEKQNELIKAITGIEDNLYNPLEIYDIRMENLEKTKNETNIKNDEEFYIKTYSGSKATYSFYFNPINDENVYLKLNGKTVDKAKIYVDKKEITEYMNEDNFGIVDIGKFKLGDKVEVEIEFVSNDKIDISDVWLYYEDSKVYEKAMKILSQNQLVINKIDGVELEGNINANKDGVLLFTIPYDKYLNVYVDGNRVNTYKLLDSLIGIDISEGNHKIALKYEPIYMIYVISGSLIAIILATIFLILERNKKF